MSFVSLVFSFIVSDHFLHVIEVLGMDFIAGGSKIQSVSEEHGCAHCKYTRKDVIRKFLDVICLLKAVLEANLDILLRHNLA